MGSDFDHAPVEELTIIQFETSSETMKDKNRIGFKLNYLCIKHRPSKEDIDIQFLAIYASIQYYLVSKDNRT